MSRRKTNIDPIELLFQSGKMFDGYKVLFDYAPKNTAMSMSLLVPATILSAFASELLLKCLLCLDKGYVVEGHNLKILFNLLSPKMKAKIEERWNLHAQASKDHWDRFEKKRGIKVARDLPTVLSEQGDAFKLMRYRHESLDTPFHFQLFEFPSLLGNVAFELKPDWPQKAKDLFDIMQKAGKEDAAA